MPCHAMSSSCYVAFAYPPQCHFMRVAMSTSARRKTIKGQCVLRALGAYFRQPPCSIPRKQKE